jgi:membrane fusion protein (multidrug efflux system)
MELINIFTLSHEGTDDAQIEKNMNPIIPRVSGYVSKVYIKDNNFVKKEILYLQLTKDYQLKMTTANLAAEGNLRFSKADIIVF